MRKFYLRTPHGSEFYIHENGNIERADCPGFRTSGQWKLTGIRLLSGTDRPTRKWIPFAHLANFLETQPEWKFKNGRPRFTVIDYDHGTQREWGNTRYHGIAGISLA